MGGESSTIDYEQGKISASPAHPEEIVRDALLEEEKKESSITDYEQGKIQGKLEILGFLGNFFEELCNEIAKNKKSKLDFFTAEEIAVRVMGAVRKEIGAEEK